MCDCEKYFKYMEKRGFKEKTEQNPLIHQIHRFMIYNNTQIFV